MTCRPQPIQERSHQRWLWPFFAGLVLSAAGVSVHAQDRCALEIIVDDTPRFQVDEIVVPLDCPRFELTLTHVGRLPKLASGVNWVLTNQEHVNAVAREGALAGAKHDWLKPDDARVIASTPVVGRGESVSIQITPAQLDTQADYRFVCTVDGRSPVMRGRLVLTP